MARLTTAQPKFKLLVANLEGASDPSKGPSGNPVKLRTGFEMQLFPELARGAVETRVPDPNVPGLHTYQGLVAYTTPPVPVGVTAVLTVSDNDFTFPAVLYLGDFVLTSNEDYTPGGTTDLTAVEIAAAIDALPGFTAVAVLSDVNITGPFGVSGNDLGFSAVYRGSVQNFILNPTDGFLAGGEPYIGPPNLLP